MPEFSASSAAQKRAWSVYFRRARNPLGNVSMQKPSVGRSTQARRCNTVGRWKAAAACLHPGNQNRKS